MTKTATVPAEAIAFPLVSGPVVYFLMFGEECVYVGASKNLHLRLPDHINRSRRDDDRVFDSVRYIHVDRSRLYETESFWIKELKPRLNRASLGRTKKYILSASINPKIGQAIKRFIAEKHNGKLSATRLVELAFKEFLEREGYLPYSPK